ncbi:MAG: GNAT family N-acetyltransferase [Cellulomonadaceae bacterium]
MDVSLRNVEASDLPDFFGFQSDPDANTMAGFTAVDPGNRDDFDAFWRRVLGGDRFLVRTIEVEDNDTLGAQGTARPGGYVMAYTDDDGLREVRYWIDPALWGKGVVSSALAIFLTAETHRPLHAEVASDNAAALRALKRCGFVVTGTDVAYAPARGAAVERTSLRLD